MSSQFTAAEIELARLGLAALSRANSRRRRRRSRARLHRAGRAGKPAVRSLIVVDALAEVIEWHEQGLLPLGKQLTGDPRCRLVNGDFFAMSAFARGFDRRCAAAAASMRCWWTSITRRANLLHPRHAALYEPEGLARLADHLHPGGVFALWSNDPPDRAFERVLAGAFATVERMS